MESQMTICVDINPDILFNLDSYVLRMKRDKPRQHYSRKKVIEEALDYYLKIHLGFPYILRNKQ